MLTPTNIVSTVSSSASSPSSLSQSLISTLSNMSKQSTSSSSSMSVSLTANVNHRAQSGSGQHYQQQQPRKVRIDTGATIIDENRIRANYANGYVVQSQPTPPSSLSGGTGNRRYSDYDDQYSSSSNSSASYSTAKYISKTNGKSKSQQQQQSNQAQSQQSQPSTGSHPKANEKSVNSQKVKSSPKHLLYEVLLSPIKRKVNQLLEQKHTNIMWG